MIDGSDDKTDQLVFQRPSTNAGMPDAAELPALLEALLLVSPEPAELRDLAATASVSEALVEDCLTSMAGESSRGWVVVRHGTTAQLASAPRFAHAVRQFLRLDRQPKLSGAS